MAARGSRSAAPAPITLAPIVLIKGPEGLLVDRALDRLRALAHEADPNLERTDINAATYQAGQIDVIASPSLFGESRMVIIRDLETMSDALANDLIAYAGAPAPDVWMFLAHPGGNARGKKVIDTITKAKWPVIPADPLKNDRDKLALIASDVRAARRQMDTEAQQALVDALGNDPRAMAGALAQLLSDVSGRITLEDVRRYQAGQISFAQVRSYNLDEYVGLPRDHYEGYANFIHRNLVDLVDMPEGAAHGPDGWCDDLHAGAAAYDEAIKADGGIDIQVLGIGSDGHIGFNEPGGTLASRTHVGVLTEQTRRDNARFFDGDIDQVPTHCVTQGLGTIMDSRAHIFIATGAGKADAVKAMIEGGVTQRWPASILQHHPDVTVLLDEAAASKLELADFYKEVWEKEHL